jgi:acetyl-CoA C-acetyltransferase
MSDGITPVIVGVGEITDRPETVTDGLEPLALMAKALERADQDAGGGLLRFVDSLDVVNLMSWRYSDITRQLSDRLGIEPRRATYGKVGGESPLRYLYEAALRIARGEIKVAAIVGAEAQHTVKRAQKHGTVLHWTPQPYHVPSAPSWETYLERVLNPVAVHLGAARPVTVYPFYEVATAAHWRQVPREALEEAGDLWARYSTVAATNPGAWIRRRFTREEIIVPTLDNRLIAWPYTKLMTANPTVNQGAGVLVTSVTFAKEAGIPGERMVHIWGGAAATEPPDYVDRDCFYESHAQNVVLETARSVVGDAPFDALELYSCFPCVPKMARRTLGLGADFTPSVTGGLTFFGAPLNNHMTHAACAMVHRLREGVRLGLLYGQGEFVTKHRSLILSSEPPERSFLGRDASVQEEADRRRRPVPPFRAGASGTASIETFTVLYDGHASVRHGVVIARTADGGRTLAFVPASDERTLDTLLSLEQSPVGADGELRPGTNGIPFWRMLA